MLFLPGKHQHFICQNIFIGDPYVGFKLIILIGSGMRFIRTGAMYTSRTVLPFTSQRVASKGTSGRVYILEAASII